MSDRIDVLSALADPHRLAIVDALALSDLNPGHLAREVGIGTSLLAHHLRVLERSGVVERRRSEGDGRRSYMALDLRNAIVAAAVARPMVASPRVVFVCTHNSARSQFAAALWARASALPVASAGTRPAERIHPRASAELTARGLEPISPAPQSLETVLEPQDLVVAVCDNAFEDLEHAGAQPVHWSVPDPAASDEPATFTSAFDDINRRVQRLAAALTTG